MSEETAVPTFVYEPDANAGSFVMLIAQEEHPTVDGRMFSAGAIDWRELPIPLTLNRINSAEGQHKTAVGIGSVTEIWREGTNIYGRGYFSSDSSGQEARTLIKEGTISGVSADVGGVVIEEMSTEHPEHPSVRKLFTKGTIIGVTALLHASFNETKIAVESPADDALTAAAADGWRAPLNAFSNPNLSQPTPLTVTEDGRVFGHAAVWGTCHVGYQDRCVTPPRSTKNYAFFNIGEVLTDSGKSVPVGRITANTNHAPIEFGAQPAKDHYDHTGFAAAYVKAGEDEHGIWFSGVLAPDASEAQVANLRSAGVSGDWRSINGNLEMVGLLAVNTPGFPVPRAQGSIVAGAQMSLVAAGVLERSESSDCGCNDETDAGFGEDCGCEDTTEEEFGKDCGCGCKGKGDCGKKMGQFAYDGNAPIDWNSDLDVNFLSGIRQHLMDIEKMVDDANQTGTALSLKVQGYASYLKGVTNSELSVLNRSLDREEDATEVDEEDDGEMDSEVDEDEQTNRPAKASYSDNSTMSFEARLALIDLDFEVLV